MRVRLTSRIGSTYNLSKMKIMDPIQFAKMVADETRHEIMLLLCGRWLSVNDIVDNLSGLVNQPTVSHHLKKLEETKLVDVKQEGRFRFYCLNQERVSGCCGMLVDNFAPDYKSESSKS